MMITKNTIDFLSELKDNNNRDWFLMHKNQYEIVKNEIKNLTLELLNVLKTMDVELLSLEPKDCTYRIYRDIRFSKDKTPYKTHIGIFVARGGKNSSNPGYYLHIEPDQSFVGGGLYLPPPDVLKNVRQEIYYNVEEFNGIINSHEFSKFYNGLSDFERLKNPPKGYDAEFEYIDLLKNKSFVVASPISDEFLINKNCLSHLTEAFNAMHPFVKFLYKSYEK